MVAMRRLLRAFAAILLLGGWLGGGVAAAVADAAAVAAPSLGAHLEAPDASGTHAAPHADDCAFCQLLHLAAAPHVLEGVPLAHPAPRPPVPTAPLAIDGVAAARGVARAPPARG